MAYNPQNPNGQATPANSSPVVLDTVDSGYLSTIATNTGAQAQDFQSSGTIVALNGTVSVTGQGVYTVTASITGTWVGTIVFEGQTQDGNWSALPANILSSTTPYTTISSATTNGVYIITGGGFLNIRVRASAYTSGTIAVGLDGSLSQQTIYSGQLGQWNVNQNDFSTSGTLGALNATLPLTVRGTSSAYAYISGTWVGTIQFQGTIDGTNFVPLNAVQGGLSNAYSTAGFTGNGGVRIALPGGFTKIQAIMTAYTSGTATVSINASVGPANVEVIQLNPSNLQTSLPDSMTTGQSAQTALVNNILTTTAGTAATSSFGYRSASVQIVSTGTAGAFIFEGSNDNVNFQTIPVWNQLILTGTPITAAITATASQLVYIFPITTNYIRVRISTAITGGSIQAFSRLSPVAWIPPVVQVAQNTAANLLTTATIGSGTVTTVTTVSTVTADNLAASTVADIASAAITTTTTSAAVAMTNISTASFVVACTASSGTTPTLDVVVQESLDNVNWYDVYHFERITGTGVWVSPTIRLNGQQIRYVRTVGGTTPSFTMSLNRQIRHVSALRIIRIFDRSIAPNSLNSTTAVLQASGCSKVQIVQSSAAGATVAPVITLQGSEDNVNFYQLGTTAVTVTGTASTNSMNVATFPVMPKYVRGIVTTAGTGAVLNYVSLTGME